MKATRIGVIIVHLFLHFVAKNVHRDWGRCRVAAGAALDVSHTSVAISMILRVQTMWSRAGRSCVRNDFSCESKIIQARNMHSLILLRHN